VTGPQLYIDNCATFKQECTARLEAFRQARGGVTPQDNLTVYNMLRAEKWKALSSEEKAHWENEARKLRSAPVAKDEVVR